MPETPEPIAETFDIALGNPGEQDCSTLVLSGVDLVVPLEIDLDCDPLHDDEVRLKSETSSFERVLLSSDPDVKPDEEKRLLLYRFRAVPPGVYRVSVKIGERWSDLVVGLVVSRKGAFLGDTKLGDDDPEGADPPAEPQVDEPKEPEPEPEELGDFMDVNDGFAQGIA